MRETSPAVTSGECRYASGRWSFYDSTGEYDPRGGGALPSATEVGEMLFSWDGSTFERAKPIVSDKGFVLTSDAGNMIVVET
jgi:hypothetical protein